MVSFPSRGGFHHYESGSSGTAWFRRPASAALLAGLPGFRFVLLYFFGGPGADALGHTGLFKGAVNWKETHHHNGTALPRACFSRKSVQVGRQVSLVSSRSRHSGQSVSGHVVRTDSVTPTQSLRRGGNSTKEPGTPGTGSQRQDLIKSSRPSLSSETGQVKGTQSAWPVQRYGTSEVFW